MSKFSPRSKQSKKTTISGIGIKAPPTPCARTCGTYSQPGIEYVLILSGDQLYRMDYSEMLATHLTAGADVTIAAMPVHRREASGLGIMRMDATGRVVGFLEKPKTESELKDVAMDPAWIEHAASKRKAAIAWPAWASICSTAKRWSRRSRKPTITTSAKKFFPPRSARRRVQMHVFDGYWEDIGTIRSFYDANLRLAQPNPPFELASATAPIYTRTRSLPPSRIDGLTMQQSLIADGCMIGAGTRIENSVIGLRCQIGKNVTIRNSVIMGVDFYETPAQLEADRAAGRPPIGIGDGAVIENAIVDKNCHVGAGARSLATRRKSSESSARIGKCSTASLWSRRPPCCPTAGNEIGPRAERTSSRRF